MSMYEIMYSSGDALALALVAVLLEATESPCVLGAATFGSLCAAARRPRGDLVRARIAATPRPRRG